LKLRRRRKCRTKPVFRNRDKNVLQRPRAGAFHAIYAEYEALIEVETLAVFRGVLPRRALALVLEWAAFHRTELRDDWVRARNGETLTTIDPLE
jgi:hypothetical protein